MSTVVGEPFAESLLTVVGQSSEVTGYEASNVIQRKGFACGAAWRTSSATSHYVNLTIPARVTDAGMWFAVLYLSEVSGSTLGLEVTLGRGTGASPGADIATATTCTPTGQIVGYRETSSGGGAFSAVYVKFETGGACALDVPLILIGQAASVTTALVTGIDFNTVDPSQRWTSQSGTIFARAQRIYHELRLRCAGTLNDGGVQYVLTQASNASNRSPLLVIANVDEMASWARTLVGVLSAPPKLSLPNGTPVTSFDIDVREIPR